MITPFVFMLSSAFKPNGLVFVEPLRIIPKVLFLDNFRRIFADPLYAVWYWNSVRIVLITLPLRAFVSALPPTPSRASSSAARSSCSCWPWPP